MRFDCMLAVRRSGLSHCQGVWPLAETVVLYRMVERHLDFLYILRVLNLPALTFAAHAHTLRLTHVSLRLLPRFKWLLNFKAIVEGYTKDCKDVVAFCPFKR